ncbi:hypothetical protein TNIN_192021 [Trichonephila inaurata madagascariensis]|uniref:Uncharacterized protein n=1 Tax=Trichonephila inaurata madagascariensis TaxID=2747483 RepID=A0A8X7CK03_9ARAC|nr:hypothetical protein TNIN_192021 [Trichonephila inaurata madagascariensis]
MQVDLGDHPHSMQTKTNGQLTKRSGQSKIYSFMLFQKILIESSETCNTSSDKNYSNVRSETSEYLGLRIQKTIQVKRLPACSADVRIPYPPKLDILCNPTFPLL